MDRVVLHSEDGTRLSAAVWNPSGSPRGEIALLHGLAEHLGRYDHVGTALAEAGYRVLAVELRGHGQSFGARGHVDRWEQYVQDARALLSLRQGGPWAFVGHSMGALVIMDWLRQADPSDIPVGVALSGPLLGVAITVPPWKASLGRFFSRYVPSLSMPSGLDPNGLCTDRAVVDAYVRDPLVYRTVTARWFTEMTAATARVEEFTPDLPMWVAWGTADPIVSIPAIERLLARAPQVQGHPWPGFRHEIFNEGHRARVLMSLRAWLDDRFEGRGA